MDGGTKYLVKMEIYHTVVNRYVDDMNSFAKLKWKSDKFRTEVIP